MNDSINISTEAYEELKGRHLLFNIEDLKYGVSLEFVLEIINIQLITKLPGVIDYIKGIINLRGKIVPIIDVRLKLGLEEREYDDKTCIIVLDVNSVNIGIIVDSVSEVVNISPSQLSSPPTSGDLQTRFFSSVCELGDKVILNLDCEKFLKSDLESISF